MAVEVRLRRRVRRHAGMLAVTGLILAVACAGVFYKDPKFIADAGRALVNPQLHVQTGTNGLAKFQFGSSAANAPASSLGNASEAGQRVQMQLLLESK